MNKKNNMKLLAAVLAGCLLILMIPAEAASPARIKFVKGKSRSIWSGVIRDGNKKFRIYLAKGQVLKVAGEDVYTWFVITPKGSRLGCDEADYCAPESETLPAPDSGDYTVSTDYRMSSCAACPVSKTRRVTVAFEIR